MTITDEERIEILAEALMVEPRLLGWLRARSLNEVPETVGHYSIYDGISIRGCGVVWNMRKGIESATYFRSLKLPILLYLPDKDGSAALWLDGKILCERCKAVHDVFLHSDEEDDRSES